MTDVRPQAMALQNSITLDKKFLIEISISHPTVMFTGYDDPQVSNII